MASQVDQGPASGNAAFFFGTSVGLEVHVAQGSNPLDPNHAPFVDPSIAATFTPVNKTVAGVNFANPC